MTVCSICLRANINLSTVSPALISFYDNLLDHEIFFNILLCATCKNLLKKCYEFKLLCQKSNKILLDRKKKEMPEILSENLHSLIQPHYDKVSEIIESENITILVVTNNDNSNPFPNNNGGLEFIKNNDCVIIDDDDDDAVEKIKNIIRNNPVSFKTNETLKKSIEQSELNLSTEPCQKTDLNLRDNEVNIIGDVRDNKNNRIGVRKLNLSTQPFETTDLNLSDNEVNSIGDDSDNENNKIGVRKLNLSTEPCETTDLNLSDNEVNFIGDDSDNENNRIGVRKLELSDEPCETTYLNLSDNEVNFIGDVRDNENNRIGVRKLNLSTEACQKQDLNLSGSEENVIGDVSDNENNRIGGSSDNKNNNIENNYDDDHDSDVYSIGDANDNDYNRTDDDSSNELDLINKLLEDAKQISAEMRSKNYELWKRIAVKKKEIGEMPSKNVGKYDSIYDILVFKSEEEAKLELLDRPNSDYYKNAIAKCTICYTVFKSQKLLEYHMTWHDPSAGDHVCNICEMRFKRRKQYNRHKTCTHYARYSCKICPLITNHKSVMLSHAELHWGTLKKCKYCGETYRLNQNYLAHLRKFHPAIYSQKNNVCTLCGRNFVSPSGLKMHKARKHQLEEEVETESSVKCDMCDLIFANEEAYTVHVLNTPCHNDVASVISRRACSLCGKRFDDRKLLLHHKREVHPLKTKMYATGTCRLCRATGSKTIRWLYDHYKMKHPKYPINPRLERDHLCEQCGRRFRLKCNLMEHMRVHTGERPFACGECGATFRTKMRLTTHEERHKPPSRVCEVCGKKFVSAANLYNHMKVHITDRSYKCMHCNKGFVRPSSLKEHIRGVHLNIRRVRKSRKENEPTE